MIERTNESIRPVDLLAVLKRATTRPDWPPIVTSQEWRDACAQVVWASEQLNNQSNVSEAFRKATK